MNNRDNYLEIHVGISTRARWYLDLQETMARLYVRCRKNRFHITSLFMHDDTKKDELKDALSRLLFHRSGSKTGKLSMSNDHCSLYSDLRSITLNTVRFIGVFISQ